MNDSTQDSIDDGIKEGLEITNRHLEAMFKEMCATIDDDRRIFTAYSCACEMIFRSIRLIGAGCGEEETRDRVYNVIEMAFMRISNQQKGTVQ